MSEDKKPARPRNVANDLIDALESAASKWTRQKKSEEKHPGNRRFRFSPRSRARRRKMPPGR
jgi:hypothetical protein